VLDDPKKTGTVHDNGTNMLHKSLGGVIWPWRGAQTPSGDFQLQIETVLKLTHIMKIHRWCLFLGFQ